MSKLSKEMRKELIRAIVVVITLTIAGFCGMACIDKLVFKEPWLGQSITMAISVLFGGMSFIITCAYPDIKGVEQTDEEVKKYVNNFLKMMFLFIITVMLLIMFIGEVIMQEKGVIEYVIIAFLGIWLGMFLTVKLV